MSPIEAAPGISKQVTITQSIAVAAPARIREWKDSTGPEIQAELRRRLTDLFSRGYAIAGFRRGHTNCEYVLEPYED
jgi:predicted GNAT superfamily acetyltransferase